jgi:cytochrome b561
MNESITAWPLSLRLAHWLNAVLLLAALGLGAYMVLLVANPAQRFELTQTHKTIGITILALTVVRLCCRTFMRAPKPEQVAPSILLAAKASHIALYLLLLLMPLSGWLMATSTPIRVPTWLFGLLELPYPLAPNSDVSTGSYRAYMPRLPPRLPHSPARCRYYSSRVYLARSDAGAHVAKIASEWTPPTAKRDVSR